MNFLWVAAAATKQEPDVLLMALLTIGGAGVAAIVGMLGYAIRTRVGFWLHRPPERSSDSDATHH